MNSVKRNTGRAMQIKNSTAKCRTRRVTVTRRNICEKFHLYPKIDGNP